VLDESVRGISPRNAFMMTNLLGEVTLRGTAASAQRILKRPDVYGKTGTTNDSIDAWFAGYQPSLVAITWIGFDAPRNLGARETGGGLALPIWISFMETALNGVPVAVPVPPEGVTNAGGDWFYTEYGRNTGVTSLGVDDKADTPGNDASTPAPPAADERNRIIDLFKQ
jgi:penicillin-binding protein 1A